MLFGLLPRSFGEMIQFDGCIFFKWVGSMTSLYTVDASAIQRENPAEAVVITGVYTYDV